MASVSKDSKGWRIQFVDANGTRKTMRLSGIPKMNKSRAEQIGRHVDELNGSKISGESIDRQTSLWLADVGKTLHDKLMKVGLIDRREASTLGMFLKGYLERRVDAKPATIRKWQSAVNHLIEHLGDHREMRSINAGHADEFRSYLYKAGQAENTVRRYCGLAKQFFRAALRRRLIDENPFSDQVAAVRGNAAKFHFISRDDTDKLLKACPDLQWRLILSLARFGGLRCPSEILALNWEDIDWAGKRFTVTSPKTAHHEGGSNRVVPLFPELLAVLTEGKLEATQKMNGNAADSIRGPVITRYRDSTQNLRTTFQKIIKRARLTTWPKLFQNLRSTRETELAEKFPLQAVTAWMGNSQLVAAKHYLQLRDEHFERASQAVPLETDTTVQQALESEKVAHKVAPKGCEDERNEKPTKAKNPEKLDVFRGSSDSFAPLRDALVGAEGLEPPTPSV